VEQPEEEQPAGIQGFVRRHRCTQGFAALYTALLRLEKQRRMLAAQRFVLRREQAALCLQRFERGRQANDLYLRYQQATADSAPESALVAAEPKKLTKERSPNRLIVEEDACRGPRKLSPPRAVKAFAEVVFSDGTSAKYRFDAHGHCEMELPASALPTTWKAYQQAYIPQGNDLNSYPRWLSVQDAERLCTQAPDCRGITYDESSRTNTQDSQPVFFIYLKSTAAFAPGPGTGWIAHVEEQKPELHGQAAVAGPVLEQSREAAGAFFFDLHQAAPQLFPEDSLELFTVVNDELRVQRLIRGSKVQSGVGIPLK